ncbi:Sas10/Utp3/C1D family-domain-containing protein [Neurospora hispaniola]|uniref:Exosome complex protein n=1 Tax=Neurospora hispaniola TaxID=588809 RepID=A0AAJ0MPK6_9PEZI|nr:Sas10/Utp3/C1D family-domain-containing protein [Neurospora hispaniola]
MDVPDITPSLEKLNVDLDQLEAALKPVLGDVGDVSSKLPLLDKAKLYVMVTYAIESILFSSLRLNGVDAKEHAIFTELTRVRQYFEKIQNIENPPQEREQTVNKEAAARFIRSDLADDEAIKQKLTELIAKEKAKAEAKEEKKRAADSSSEPTAKRPKTKGNKKKTEKLSIETPEDKTCGYNPNPLTFTGENRGPSSELSTRLSGPRPARRPAYPHSFNDHRRHHNHTHPLPQTAKTSVALIYATQQQPHQQEAKMPRQSRGSARPSVPARKPVASTNQQQQRPASTYAPPTAAPHAPPAAAAPVSQGPGLFGQMASTAAGVAIGSSIGHAIGGMFSGGGSSAAPEAAAAPVQAQAAAAQNSSWGNNCSEATKSFTQCMDQHQGNMQICGWYLEQLKACQAAASQY